MFGQAGSFGTLLCLPLGRGLWYQAWRQAREGPVFSSSRRLTRLLAPPAPRVVSSRLVSVAQELAAKQASEAKIKALYSSFL